LVKYNNFYDLPIYIVDKLNHKNEISLRGKRWKILDIDQNLCAHGNRACKLELD
jgi:hypothetical protein